MSVYSVYERSDDTGPRAQRADKLLFVRDALSRPTLVFGPFWMLLKGQWVSLSGYIILAALFAGFGAVVGLPSTIWGYFYLGLNLIFALEEPLLRGALLETTGWRLVGVSEGRTEEEAEYRFITSWLQSEPDKNGAAKTDKPQSIALQTSPHGKFASALRETRPPRILN